MAKKPGTINVLAGVNGAGKSSVLGREIRESKLGRFFNPDEYARNLRKLNPAMDQSDANILAWERSKKALEDAIANDENYTFETTLGGNSITNILIAAGSNGTHIRILYVGLATVEQHIERVDARVAAGGHPIPEEKIRERYDTSRQNLIKLLPAIESLAVYDNSLDVTSVKGNTAMQVLRVEQQRVLYPTTKEDIAATPDWAKPIVMAAIQNTRPPSDRVHG